MKKRLIPILFACLVLIQLYVPISMIMQHELTLKNGTQYKFIVRPMDPYDAFRGRYVYINAEDAKVPVAEGEKLLYNQAVYVSVEKGSDGFANMTRVSALKPERGDYFKTKLRYGIPAYAGSMAEVNLPFERYYMEEKLAPEAEKAFFELSRVNRGDVYVTVRILGGTAVLERLYMKGLPVEEYIKSVK